MTVPGSPLFPSTCWWLEWWPCCSPSFSVAATAGAPGAASFHSSSSAGSLLVSWKMEESSFVLFVCFPESKCKTQHVGKTFRHSHPITSWSYCSYVTSTGCLGYLLQPTLFMCVAALLNKLTLSALQSNLDCLILNSVCWWTEVNKIMWNPLISCMKVLGIGSTKKPIKHVRETDIVGVP